ncbi:aspartate and serine-rich protein isoform X2 [Helianthus annuus]|uniref:aspartate and serine-rich protein isoform X2 n=1 Tax=Helianthus annuus TaxID=4232 RepID=UPI001652C4CB|nr:aspartate and serine-rich protein isoform X2 [Helianthus annuus]
MLIFADHCRPCIHLTKSSRRTSDNDDDSDPNYVESMDDESNDVSSLFDDSDSDVVSTDGMSDEDDEQDRDSPDYHKVDPDYHPIDVLLLMLLWRLELT